MRLERVLVSLWFLLSMAAGSVFAGFAIFQVNGVQFTKFTPVFVGAGGFISGLDIACDQGVGMCAGSGTVTRVIRTDTYDAYIWNGTSSSSVPSTGPGWQSLFNTSTLTSSEYSYPQSLGVCEIRIAPNNTKHFYAIYNGYVYSGINSGTVANPSVNWTRTAYTQAQCSANGQERLFGPWLAIDPANENIVYASTPTGGLRVTTNGGTTWSAVSGIANAATYGHLICFDPTSSVVSNATQGIYVSTYGTGVYHSTNGGTSFTLTTGTPTTHQHIICDQSGNVYLVDNSQGTFFGQGVINKYNGSAWSNYSAALGNGMHSISVDPASANNLYGADGCGKLSYSRNAGASWTQTTSPPSNALATASGSPPWLAASGEANCFSMSDLRFDPSQSNVIWAAEGIGVWYATPPTSGAANNITWTSQSQGIEQIVANRSLAVPSGPLVLTGWDRPFFSITNQAAYPSLYWPATDFAADTVTQGYGVDYAVANTDHIGVATNDSGQGWLSTNNGTSYPAWPAYPSGAWEGGDLAGSTSNNWCWINTVNGMNCTTNGGTGWSTPTIGGVSGGSGFGVNYYGRHVVEADKVTANQFYTYVDSLGTNPGIYISQNSGATWTLGHSGQFDAAIADAFHGSLKSVPGNAGNIYWSSGNQGGGCTHPCGNLFQECTTSGTTITCNSVANVGEVQAFCFGMAKSGGYPAIYIYGWVSSVLGIWVSDDHHATWRSLSNGFPLGKFDQVNDMGCDQNTYGTFYIAYLGSGWAKGKLNYLMHRDLDPASNDNSPVGLAKVA